MSARILVIAAIVGISSIASADYGRGHVLRDQDDAASLVAPAVGPLLGVSSFDTFGLRAQPLRLQSISAFDLVHAHFVQTHPVLYFRHFDALSAQRAAAAPTGPLLSVAAFDALSR